jgi:hypothetical protein
MFPGICPMRKYVFFKKTLPAAGRRDSKISGSLGPAGSAGPGELSVNRHPAPKAGPDSFQ